LPQLHEWAQQQARQSGYKTVGIYSGPLGFGYNTELNAPTLATREAQTTVVLDDGQTVVIGGLMKDDHTLNQSKIPILGDIPLIGNLFKQRGTHPVCS
jgi:Flp pilus assembly secretin CpaC